MVAGPPASGKAEEEGLSPRVSALRPDISFVRRGASTNYTELIDISCPYGRITYGDSSLEKTYSAKITEYRESADELQQQRRFYTNIIPIIVSSIGAVYPPSLKALQTVLSCTDREIGVIGQRISEAAIAGSFDIWRIYMEGRPRPLDERIDRIMNREENISGAEEAIADEEIRRDEPEGIVMSAFLQSIVRRAPQTHPSFAIFSKISG
jgi:hypothetical protein